MQCPCGDESRIQEHTVKTINFAQQWDSSITEADLPIRISRHVCNCGRESIQQIEKNAVSDSITKERFIEYKAMPRLDGLQA